MKCTFFKIPTNETTASQTEFNSFCSQHRISQIEKNFVANGDNSFWSICVTWLENESSLAASANTSRKSRIDYKDSLFGRFRGASPILRV